MNREQNIDDILKLLKDSVSSENIEAEQTIAVQSDQSISNEDVQEQLRYQYMDAGQDSSEEAPSSEYIIDSDFLAVALENTEDVEKSEIIEEAESLSEPLTELEETYEEPEQLTVDDVLSSGVVVGEELEENSMVAENVTEDTVDADISEDDAVSDEIILTEVAKEPEYTLEDGEAFFEDIDEFEDDDEIDSIVFVDDEPEDIDIIDADEEDEAAFEVLEDYGDTVAEQEDEPHETFLASMLKTGMDFTTDDMYNASHRDEDSLPEDLAEPDATQADGVLSDWDSAQQLSDGEQNVEEATSDETVSETEDASDAGIDPSTVNIMMQLCEKQEVEETIGEKGVDDFLKFEQSEDTDVPVGKNKTVKEYTDKSQKAQIAEEYKKTRTTKLLKLVGCAVLAIIALIYDLMPILDAELSGILDYQSYPEVYALVGLQFVVFAVAIRYKELWQGLKRAFSLAPTYESTVAVMLSLTAIYDLIIVIILAFSGDALPNMYNGIAVLAMTIAALSDYLMTYTGEVSFRVYSDEAEKYTLTKEKENGILGAKMYAGGLSKDKTVYTSKSVELPRGFVAMSTRSATVNKLITLGIIPALVIGMIVAIISIPISDDYAAYAACASFVICMYALLPIAMMLGDTLPYAIAAYKLSKRKSAVAGPAYAQKYSDIDVLVFNDLHIFKKCNTEDVGIAIYDTKVGYFVLGCLDALYTKLGGPLSGMKIKLPDVFKFDNVEIKRIARNGVEAIIDRKHTLIVGDREYMKRYGLVFPQNETDNGRSTLCVSLNGKVTAKLSVKYETEPVFEMLAERLAAEGISCAVQTLDPLVNGTLIANSRTIGESPISVVHQGIQETSASNKFDSAEDNGVICCSSKIKFAEVAVWLKRLAKSKKIIQTAATIFSGVGILSVILLLVFGAMEYVNQVYLFFYILAEFVTLGVIMALKLPSGSYFTVDALYDELQAKYTKQLQAEQDDGGNIEQESSDDRETQNTQTQKEDNE